MNRSKVLKADNYSWSGVDRKQYKTTTQNFKGIHRFSLLGDEISELNFQTRYFEIQPGGYSSLEMHHHPHSVIIIRGAGTLILNNKLVSISLHDVIFIAPDTIHQFHADKQKELGFICTVDRYRDKPQIPDQKTIKKIISSEKVLNKIKK